MNIDLQACPVCQGSCAWLDVVDFNKSCADPRTGRRPLSGVPVYYAQCKQCGFCFAPELHAWSSEDFESKIYNAEYVQVDPDYVEARPRANVAALLAMFGGLPAAVRHLDYGGGNGLLARLLREAGWDSSSYDPFLERDVDMRRLGKFDLITAYEVFEHAPDVGRLMADLRTLLHPHGLVLFTTNLSDREIDPGQRLTWWYASPRNGHISLFSRRSLVLLAGRHDLKFGSFSQSSHMFYTTLPAWAAPVIRPAPNR